MLTTRRLNLAMFVATALMLATTLWVRAQTPATKPADVSGTWKWTAQGPGGDTENVLTLKQEGDKLTGTVTGFGGNESPIEDGKLKDGQVSFKVTNDFNGMKFVTNYSGTVSDDTLKGKTEIVIANNFEAKRSK